MKLVEKKCPNCGASLKFNKEDTSITCNYCKAVFDIEKDPTEEVAEEFVLHFKTVRKMSKTIIIFTMVIFVVILLIIIFAFTRISGSIPKFK